MSNTYKLQPLFAHDYASFTTKYAERYPTRHGKRSNSVFEKNLQARNFRNETKQYLNAIVSEDDTRCVKPVSKKTVLYNIW